MSKPDLTEDWQVVLPESEWEQQIEENKPKVLRDFEDRRGNIVFDDGNNQYVLKASDTPKNLLDADIETFIQLYNFLAKGNVGVWSLKKPIPASDPQRRIRQKTRRA